MLNETEIRCFLAVAEELNFTKAANILYMTQQSVSKTISNLENDIGFTLFQRNHHVVQLTKAGENFYAFFKEVQERYQETLSITRQYYDARNKLLRVGYLEWVEFLPEIRESAKAFSQRNPAVQFVAEKHSRQELNRLLMDGTLDVIYTYDDFLPQKDGLHVINVAELPLTLLVSKTYPGDRHTVSDFRKEPFIWTSAQNESKASDRDEAIRQSRRVGLAPKEIVLVPNLESAYMAAEFGQGVFLSTTLSRIHHQRNLIAIETGVKEEMVCVWRADNENPLICEYTRTIL